MHSIDVDSVRDPYSSCSGPVYFFEDASERTSTRQEGDELALSRSTCHSFLFLFRADKVRRNARLSRFFFTLLLFLKGCVVQSLHCHYLFSSDPIIIIVIKGKAVIILGIVHRGGFGLGHRRMIPITIVTVRSTPDVLVVVILVMTATPKGLQGGLGRR